MDVSVHPMRSIVAIACRPKKEGEDGDNFMKARKGKKTDPKKKKSKQLGQSDGRLEFWDYNKKQFDTFMDTINFGPTCLC